MKTLFWSLVKINAIGLALLSFLVLWISNSGGEPSGAASLFFVCCTFYLGFLNVRAVYRSRQQIAATIQNGAVDVAASAIEFRDAARARVDERMKSREQQRKSNES